MFENLFIYLVALVLLVIAGYMLPKRPFLVGGLLLVALVVGGFLYLNTTMTLLSQETSSSASQTRAPASIDSPSVRPPPIKLADLPGTLEEFSATNPQASVAYSAPKEMKKGEDANVRAVLSIQQSVEALKEVLKKQTVAEIQVDGARVDVATRMIATLSGFGFTINPSGPQEQPVLTNAPTTWSWQVLANQEGKRTLNLKIEAVIGVNGQLLRREIEVKNWEIEVEVGAWEQAQKMGSEFADFLADLKEIWLGLAFFGSLVFGWFRRKSGNQAA
jgi:hypothetical protein